MDDDETPKPDADWLRWTLDEIAQGEARIGLDQPETYEHFAALALARGCQRAMDAGGFDSILRPFAAFEAPEARAQLRSVFEAAARDVKRRLAVADPRYSALLKLLAEADANAPRLGQLALTMHFPQLLHVRASQRVALGLRAAWNAASAEERFRHLAAAAIPLIGRVYDPYLRVIWTLSGLARGDWSPPVSQTGVLLRHACDRMPHLVDRRLGAFRNVEAHDGIRFLPGERVRARDADGDQFTLSIGEFALMLESAFRVAAPTLHGVINLYVVRGYFLAGGALDVALEAAAHLASGDPAREALAGEAWSGNQLELLGPPLRFAAAHPRRDEIFELLRQNIARETEAYEDVMSSVAA